MFRNLFHFHKFKVIKKVRSRFKVSYFFGSYHTEESAIKVLEKCECGDYKAYIIDTDGNVFDKVPELLFPEEFDD